MKHSIKISIDKACGENFNDFEQTATGGFCKNCQKEVRDFSGMSDREIFDFFKERKGKVCGRFYREQPGTFAEPEKIKGSRFPLMAASLGLLSFLLPVKGKAENQAFSVRSEQAPIPESEQKTTLLPADTSYVIKGKVVDQDDQLALPGVGVSVKDSKIITQTDSDGYFSLILTDYSSSSTTLIFSYIGYTTKEQEISLSKPVVDLGEIKIELEVFLLGEVVCIHTWTPRGIWHRITHLFRR